MKPTGKSRWSWHFWMYVTYQTLSASATLVNKRRWRRGIIRLQMLGVLEIRAGLQSLCSKFVANLRHWLLPQYVLIMPFARDYDWTYGLSKCLQVWMFNLPSFPSTHSRPLPSSVRPFRSLTLSQDFCPQNPIVSREREREREPCLESLSIWSLSRGGYKSSRSPACCRDLARIRRVPPRHICSTSM